MALWKELYSNKGIFNTLKSQKWAAGGEKEVSRKDVSIHLNKTKHQLKKNPQATQEAWGMEKRPFQGLKLSCTGH